MARRARKREAVDKPAPSAKGRQSARNPGPAPTAPVEDVSTISSKEICRLGRRTPVPLQLHRHLGTV